MTEWRKVKLGDICETQYGYTASAETVDTGTKKRTMALFL